MHSLLRYKARKSTTRIILHDSHTTPDASAVGDVSRWAAEAHSGGLKMGLLSIGYHYIIERDGTVVKCRPTDLIGSHSPGHNLDSIGVCVVGGRNENGDAEQNFTRQQRQALIRLCHELVSQYGAKVVGHSEVQKYRHAETPKCPFLDMDLLRDDINLFAAGIAL